MTRSSEDNMANVAVEVNQMDTDYGKHFKILLPNDQIKGNFNKHIVRNFFFVALSKICFIFFRTANNSPRQKHKSKRLQILCRQIDSLSDRRELESTSLLRMFSCYANRFDFWLETSQFVDDLIFQEQFTMV